MASSQEALDSILFTSDGPLVDGVLGADLPTLDPPTVVSTVTGELVPGLINRLRRAGLFLLGEGVKSVEEGRAGLRPTLFSKLKTLALTLLTPSEVPVSSELEESCRAS